VNPSTLSSAPTIGLMFCRRASSPKRTAPPRSAVSVMPMAGKPSSAARATIASG